MPHDDRCRIYAVISKIIMTAERTTVEHRDAGSSPPRVIFRMIMAFDRGRSLAHTGSIENVISKEAISARKDSPKDLERLRSHEVQ
jgi:hypothetical protein